MWRRDEIHNGVRKTDRARNNSSQRKVSAKGENSIILYGGANKSITNNDIKEVFFHFTSGDFLLVQNEINMTDKILKDGENKGMKIFFNPAPMNKDVLEYPLECVDTFIVNEIEGSELTGKKSLEFSIIP